MSLYSRSIGKCFRFGDSLCGSMGPGYECRSMEEIQRLPWGHNAAEQSRVHTKSKKRLE